MEEWTLLFQCPEASRLRTVFFSPASCKTQAGESSAPVVHRPLSGFAPLCKAAPRHANLMEHEPCGLSLSDGHDWPINSHPPLSLRFHQSTALKRSSETLQLQHQHLLHWCIPGDTASRCDAHYLVFIIFFLIPGSDLLDVVDLLDTQA